MIPPVVPSAECWPEIPGARVIVHREGYLLPTGWYHVLSRVIRPDWLARRSCGPSGLQLVGRWREPLDILLVARCPLRCPDHPPEDPMGAMPEGWYAPDAPASSYEGWLTWDMGVRRVPPLFLAEDLELFRGLERLEREAPAHLSGSGGMP